MLSAFRRWILIALLIGALLPACKPDAPVAPDPQEQPDTAGPVLETREMWCTLERYYNGPTGHDTLAIAWKGLDSLPDFYVRAIRLDSALPDTTVVMDNRDPYNRFWHNDQLLSGERWLHPGRYRIELVAHDTWEVLGTASPDLVVRSLRIDSVSATVIPAGSQFKVYLYKPVTGITPRDQTVTWFPPEVTVWLNDSQLKIFPGDYTYIYGHHWWFELDVEATSVGTGRITIKDSRSNEIAYGPQITISQPPYTVYFKNGSIELTTNVSWQSRFQVHINPPIVHDTAYVDDTTFRQSLYRYCCDSTTTGDTSRFTRSDGESDHWQAIIVVDTAAHTCRFLRLYIDCGPGHGILPRRYTLEFKNVPASISSDGTWTVSLDADAFARCLTKSEFWFGYHSLESGIGKELKATGTLLLDGTQSLTLVLSPR